MTNVEDASNAFAVEFAEDPITYEMQRRLTRAAV